MIKENLSMALIYCSDCGQQVSDKAAACPKCACPINVPAAVKTVRIALPNTNQMATGYVGLFAKKDCSIVSNGKVIWTGKHGEVATFDIDEPQGVTIDLGTWANKVMGPVKPGTRYKLVQDMGLHMKATFRLTEVDMAF